MAISSAARGAMIAALASASLSSAAVLDKRISFTIKCDAARLPNWGDCQANFDTLNSVSGSDPNYHFAVQEGNGANCITYTNGNCIVELCDYINQGYVLNSLVVDAVNNLQSDCEYVPAGGSADNTDGSMGVSIFASEQTPARRSVDKRDTTWTTAYTVDNASPSQYKQQVLNAQPGGSSWSLTTSESQTNKVEVSVSVSEDFFEIFSSSQSISYSYEKTVTESSTSTINNNCANDQTGTLYWYPLFTQYHGGYSPDGPAPVDIYIPITESDGSAAGRYQVVCSG